MQVRATIYITTYLLTNHWSVCSTKAKENLEEWRVHRRQQSGFDFSGDQESSSADIRDRKSQGSHHWAARGPLAMLEPEDRAPTMHHTWHNLQNMETLSHAKVLQQAKRQWNENIKAKFGTKNGIHVYKTSSKKLIENVHCAKLHLELRVFLHQNQLMF